MYSLRDTTKVVSFLIQRSWDQSSFATPPRLSQRNTSFIASCRQGIHQMLLTYYFLIERCLNYFNVQSRRFYSDLFYTISVHQLIKITLSGELALGVLANTVRAFSRYRQRHMMSEKPIHNFKPQRASELLQKTLEFHSSTREGMGCIPPCIRLVNRDFTFFLFTAESRRNPGFRNRIPGRTPKIFGMFYRISPHGMDVNKAEKPKSALSAHYGAIKRLFLPIK